MLYTNIKIINRIEFTITITAKCKLIENKKEEFIKITQELIKESNKEVGCISYNLYEDINNESTVTFIEVWKSLISIIVQNILKE